MLADVTDVTLGLINHISCTDKGVGIKLPNVSQVGTHLNNASSFRRKED